MQSHETAPPALNFETLNLPLGPEHRCPYIEGNIAQERACMVTTLGTGIYRSLMDHGWRRSGHILYKPFCTNCQKCVPLRIPVNDFRPSASQLRVLRRNSDLQVTLQKPEATDEKFALFLRYQLARHEGTMCSVRQEYEDFLYKSPLKSVEMVIWLGDRYIGSAIMDADSRSLSAVYNYFEPEMASRSLGTFAILKSLELARERRDEFYYMGYLIDGSAKMIYKKRFKPYQLLLKSNQWVTVR